MAGEEDVELRDLVAQTLEAKGVLGKIRAQLRSSVFLALEEQDSKEKSHPLVNERLQKYLQTKEGQLTTALVREFLEFFELDFTCAVFDPETNVLETYPGRERLAREVGLESQTSCPLLASVLQKATQSHVLRQLRFPDSGSIPSTPTFTPLPTITESDRTNSGVPPTLHTTGTPSTSELTPLDSHKVGQYRSEAVTTVTSCVKTIPSPSLLTSTGAQPLGSLLNSNENSNLRLEPEAKPPSASPLVDLTKPTSSDQSKHAELGKNSTLDFEKLLHSGSDIDKLLKQARGESESSKYELDAFFDTPLPSALDERSATSSRPTLEDPLGTSGVTKKPGALSSLRDAPTLTTPSLHGAPPLLVSGASRDLVGGKGVGAHSKKTALVDGEYDDDFHSEGGGSGTVSEHTDEFSQPHSSIKLDTTDATFSDNSLGGDFDHKEPVPS